MSHLISDHLPSLNSLKEDARALGHEAADLARDRVLQPARQLATDARQQFAERGDRLNTQLTDVASEAEVLIRENRDRAAAWISANPFAAFGLAVGAGLVLSALLRSRR
jgi:ElaB/YqjD/DUF883 family membrane-anchored ribosome-binding protein